MLNSRLAMVHMLVILYNCVTGTPSTRYHSILCRQMCVCIFIYRTSHIVSWRFTILLLDEIVRQLVKAPLAAAISLSPYLISPTHPAHA